MPEMKVVLGTMTFGESVFAPDVGEFLRIYGNAGGTELDTAYVYNEGLCERLLGEALEKSEWSFSIATKVNPRISGRLDGAAAHKQVNESLERLRRPSVDTVYLHFPDPATPVEDVLAAMADLHRQGKFRELGLSNFPAWMVADVWRICEREGWVKPTLYEGMYNPIARRAETELNACLNRFGMRFYAYNPLAGGLLTGRCAAFEDAPDDGRFTHRPGYRNRYWKKSCFDAVALLKEAATARGLGLVEAVYRWLAHHSMLSAVRGDAIIVGASKANHLAENLDAAAGGKVTLAWSRRGRGRCAGCRPRPMRLPPPPLPPILPRRGPQAPRDSRFESPGWHLSSENPKGWALAGPSPRGCPSHRRNHPTTAPLKCKGQARRGTAPAPLFPFAFSLTLPSLGVCGP